MARIAKEISNTFLNNEEFFADDFDISGNLNNPEKETFQNEYNNTDLIDISEELFESEYDEYRNDNKIKSEDIDEIDEAFFQLNPNDNVITNLFKLYSNDISDHNCNELLTAEEEIALSRKIQAGDKNALNTLVSHNVLYVNNIAKKYIGRGLDYMDLVQEGNIGLMIAAKRFNPDLGYRFSTYATWWIKQGITRAIADKSRAIRQPVYVQDMAYKIKKAISAFEQEHSREPKDDELEKITGIPKEKIDKMKAAMRTPVSLFKPINDEEDTTIGDMIEDESSMSDIARKSYLMELKTRMNEVLNKKLNDKEKFVIKCRFGIEGEQMTLQEVAAQLDITKERVRQIEAKALRKLRMGSARAALKGFEYI